MQDQGNTMPGLKDVLATDAARRRELDGDEGMVPLPAWYNNAADPPADVDEELRTALTEVHNAMSVLRTAGDHLRRAASGLPETPFSDVQARRYHALIHGTAAAIAVLDRAVDASGA